MIESLEDPYSSYLTSDEYRESLQGISGEFEGIGARSPPRPTMEPRDVRPSAPTADS